MNVGKVIKEIRKVHKLTQSALAKKLGVAPTAVSAWERNENRPLMDKISMISEMFSIPITNFFDLKDMDPNTVMLPIVGRISCGNGTIAYEEIEGYEPTPKEWLNGGEYFYLRAKGDSMIGARIYDGDLLLIRKQPEVENGEIAAVMIGEEAVLKRFYRSDGLVMLQSENAKYSPIFSSPTETRVIGKLKMNVIKY